MAGDRASFPVAPTNGQTQANKQRSRDNKNLQQIPTHSLLGKKMERVGDESFSSQFILGFGLIVSALNVNNTAKTNETTKQHCTTNQRPECVTKEDRSWRWVIFGVFLRTMDERVDIATELFDHGDDADRCQRCAGTTQATDANEDIESKISCCLASR